MELKTFSAVMVSISSAALVLCGCGGGDSNTANDVSSSPHQAPTAFIGQTMTVTVSSTSFTNGNTILTTNASPFTTASLRVADDGGGTSSGRMRHGERPGQRYMIHFTDEHSCVISHPDTGDPDESTTYNYNPDSSMLEVMGGEHDMYHLSFSSETQGQCHVEDDQGEAEDDDFTLS